jgi:hypothetical protein
MIVSLNLYGAFISQDDGLAYILSLREVCFYPMLGIAMGYNLARGNGVRSISWIMIVYLIWTYLYLVFNFDESFGPTNRLKSFWDREHEPAIIGGFCLLIGYFYFENNFKYRFILIALSIALLLLSGSRSALLGVILGGLVVYVRSFDLLRMLGLAIMSVVIIMSFSYITLADRGIDHNLIERLQQYQLAIDALDISNYLGIGSDKYGVVAGVIHKEYCLNGNCTTTMDSSLIKYFVNYGAAYLFIFVAFLVLFIIFSFINIVSSRERNAIMSMLVFSLIMGAVTGKLGAFPLNIVFYVLIGFVIKSLSRYIAGERNWLN